MFIIRLNSPKQPDELDGQRRRIRREKYTKRYNLYKIIIIKIPRKKNKKYIYIYMYIKPIEPKLT